MKDKLNDVAFKNKTLKNDQNYLQKCAMSRYLGSLLFNDKSRALLLALRTRTVSEVRSDFSGLYQGRLCPLGCREEDTLENIISCSVINHNIQVKTWQLIK